MTIQEQIKAAQTEGYSSQEIVNYLAGTNPKVQEAMKEGYAPDEIIQYLNTTPPTSHGVLDAVGSTLKSTLLTPQETMVEKAPEISKQVGQAVEAGGAGLADLATGKGLPQAAESVENVTAGNEPTTSSGSFGKTVGSFFTPNQILLQGLGGLAAKPLANAAGKVASPIVKGLVNAFPKLSDLVGATPEAVSALADNPLAVAEAKSMPEMAQEAANTVQKMSKAGISTAEAGVEALSDTTKVPGLQTKLLKYAADLRSNPLAEEGDKLAADYVADVAKNFQKDPTEQQVGDLIAKLDEKINTKWNQANPGPLTAAKEDVRRILSNTLQAQNKQYAANMAKASATFEPVSSLSKSLGLKEGLPGDSTISALSKINSPAALATQRALASFPDLASPVANSAAKDALQKSLLGRTALYAAPKANSLITAGVKNVPWLSNAVYQGLNQ